MKFLFYFSIIILTISCVQKVKTESIDVSKDLNADLNTDSLTFTEMDSMISADETEGVIVPDDFFEYRSEARVLEPTDSVEYEQRKEEAEMLRQNLAKAYSNREITLDSAGILFEEFLVQKIFPHWYGTPWDYEGHTNIPNNGEVACGYFVSTTLRHMEVQLNRYKLAQQAASYGAKSLAVDQGNVSKFYDYFDFADTLNVGLYTVGLSNHVGFIQKTKTDLFFIHSSYLDEMEVMKEKAWESSALQSSSVYVIVRVGNSAFIKQWLEGTQLKIFKPE